MKVIYNTTTYPYYKIKFTSDKYTEEGFEEHIANFHNLYNLCIEKNGKMVLIIDITDISIPPLNFIKKQVKFMKDIKLLSKEYIAETIFITSSITKKLVDILFLYEKPVTPYIIFDTEPDAVKYLKDNVDRFSKIIELNPAMKKINKSLDSVSKQDTSNKIYNLEDNEVALNRIKELLRN
jgi:hypothetical protein